jgi:hypothetical protein
MPVPASPARLPSPVIGSMATMTSGVMDPPVMSAMMGPHTSHEQERCHVRPSAWRRLLMTGYGGMTPHPGGTMNDAHEVNRGVGCLTLSRIWQGSGAHRPRLLGSPRRSRPESRERPRAHPRAERPRVPPGRATSNTRSAGTALLWKSLDRRLCAGYHAVGGPMRMGFKNMPPRLGDPLKQARYLRHLTLSHLSESRPKEVGAYLAGTCTTDDSTRVAAEAYEVVEGRGVEKS